MQAALKSVEASPDLPWFRDTHIKQASPSLAVLEQNPHGFPVLVVGCWIIMVPWMKHKFQVIPFKIL